MAITFIQEKKKQKYLLLAFGAILVIIIIIILIGFGRDKIVVSVPQLPPKKTISINFNVLENPILKELSPFEEISPFGDEKGRGNPFLPY